MGLSVKLHDYIDKYNFLKRPTNYAANFFSKHPLAYKVALIVNHLFRAAAMVGLMSLPGMPLIPSMAICLAGSVFYRLTVEKNCTYKFALPAFAGAAAFMLALPSLINLFNGIAFLSFPSSILSCASLVALPLYAVYIGLTVNYDVNHALAEQGPPEECHCKKDNSLIPDGLTTWCQNKVSSISST